jgi:hypothetical protein
MCQLPPRQRAPDILKPFLAVLYRLLPALLPVSPFSPGAVLRVSVSVLSSPLPDENHLSTDRFSYQERRSGVGVRRMCRPEEVRAPLPNVHGMLAWALKRERKSHDQTSLSITCTVGPVRARCSLTVIPSVPPESIIDHCETLMSKVPAALKAGQGWAWGASMFCQDKCSAVPGAVRAPQLCGEVATGVCWNGGSRAKCCSCTGRCLLGQLSSTMAVTHTKQRAGRA